MLIRQCERIPCGVMEAGLVDSLSKTRRATITCQ